MKADKILTPTNYVKNDVETHTPFQGEVAVVGQGVDNLPELNPPENVERSYDLIYVGGTLGRKNPQFLEEALSAAVEEGFRVATVNHSDLVLPGETFTDISDEELAHLYRSSRFYLHPSHVEGFGRGPVEAQRYGCVPMAFQNPVNEEVLGNAYLTISEVEDVLIYLEDLETRETWKKKARANSRKHSWKKAGEKFLEAIK